MLKQFRLDQIEVDVDRCWIKNGSSVNQIEPRAMDVLAYLAERPKSVVSQEELFSALWPDTVFSNGAIQRCIALLRKALGEDAKNARLIVTHPKRGYSLDIEPKSIKTKEAPKRRFKSSSAVFFAVLCFIAVIGWMFTNGILADKNSQRHKFSGVQIPVTSSSDYDFKPIFTADGEQILFIRQTGNENQIIRKHLSSGAETVVISGDYDFQSLIWSYDYRFAYTIIRNSNGDQLHKLTLDNGELELLHSVTPPFDLWHIADTEHSLYLLTAKVSPNTTPKTALLSFNKSTNVISEVLVSDQVFTPYRLSPSAQGKTLFLAGEGAGNTVELRTYNIESQLLSESFLNLDLGFTEIAAHPQKEILLVHHMNQLFEVDVNGTKSPIDYTGFHRIFNPQYSPDGKRISLSLTGLDNDLIEISGGVERPSESISVLSDSNGEDHLPRYSPSGNAIAFVSSRAGYPQVFITREDNEQRIFDNPDKKPIFRAPVWSHDGNKVVFSFSSILYIYHVDTATLSETPMLGSFSGVLDWYQDEDALLVVTKQNNQSYFARYSISDKSFKQLSPSGANFSARLTNVNELLFYTDEFVQFGQQRLPTDLFPDIRGPLVPFENGFVFQSNRSVFHFNGRDVELLRSRLPDSVDTLVDAIPPNKLLFQATTEESANIVILE